MSGSELVDGRTPAQWHGVPQPRPPSDPPRPVDTDPQRSTARKVSRILFLVVAVAAAVQVSALGGGWLLFSRFYVTTENAQVDGDRIDIRAPRSGTLTDWTVQEGSSVRAGQVLGRVEENGGGPRPKQVVRAPDAGTVALDAVSEGTYVRDGALLATAYDLADTYITARVDDDEVSEVRPGAPVRISADAFPGAEFTGVVSDVQNSTSGVFSSAPPPGVVSRSNPNVVNQYVPVRIRLLGTGEFQLVPGMNVTVHIRRP